ncbi:hypothetical protein TCAL_12749, partial [Tigriopus californicus]|eukprot:TCALIF_12749-PA protein Name:"Similar to Techylectin-5A (Tachypleus tridentatus)" AED:0.36 eAED:0.36 QI:55/0.33/0.28/0.42/1/0.85/7/0/349
MKRILLGVIGSLLALLSLSKAQDMAVYECVEKVVMSEEIVFDEEVNCRHIYHEECMNSYVTKFKSHQRNECSDQYKKKCMIVYDPVPIKIPYQFCPKKDFCRNLTRLTVKEVPREMCSMSLGKKCEEKPMLLPTIEAEEKCLEVPKEVCAIVQSNPRPVQKPVIKTWCPSLDSNDIRDCGDVLTVVGSVMYQTGIHEFPIGPPESNRTIRMDCDEDGWSVIQSRGQFGNRENYFARPWLAFVNGFGVPGMEFWLGLENMHLITNSKNYSLKITLEDTDGIVDHAIYTEFKISEKVHLRLEHGACHHGNLNSFNKNTNDTGSFADSIVWRDFRGYRHSLRSAKMAIKVLN